MQPFPYSNAGDIPWQMAILSGTYDGGMIEYNIASPWFQVGFRHDITLIPEYGGNPDNPPQVIPACPAQV